MIDLVNNNLFTAAGHCLAAADPDVKLWLTETTVATWRQGCLLLDPGSGPAPIGEPGRPARPPLVHPSRVPQRKLTTPAGRAALLHAVAHIEFNAINLAWDAVYRFRAMPRDYYDDWTRVAGEEGHHFSLVRERLRALGHDYGDFPAHNGLWEMAVRTADDPLRRMALVPRLLEARGLDVTPEMIARLEQAGDPASAAILGVILRDEVGHVAIGSRWFKHLCRQRGLEPETTFRALAEAHTGGPLRGPFNDEARRQAGFSETELAALHAWAAGRPV